LLIKKSGDMTTQKTNSLIDDYIANTPANIQSILRQLRATIKEAAPDAEEKISYQMPTFYLKGNLVHFAALKNHIGFYPTPSAIMAFSKELSGYVTSKGAIQFPLDKPLPLGLIAEMVKFRVIESLEKAEAKTKKSKAGSRTKPRS
jgi:uncharacterized protein YdhG (YjbR/CyaY superfamily)